MLLSVSVVIPCLNMAHTLRQSVTSILRQDAPVHEILVVDSQSEDGTPALVETMAAEGAPIHLLRGGRHGPGPARNLGIAAASSDVIAFLDADDLWPAGKLSLQLRRLCASPPVEVVGGFVIYCEKIDPVLLVPDPTGRVEPPLFGSQVGASLFRTSVLRRLRGFDESLRYSEDVDLLLRIREQNIPFTILRAITLYYRRTGASMMDRDDPRKAADFRRAVALSLARRRRLGQSGPQDLSNFASYLEPVTADEVRP